MYLVSVLVQGIIFGTQILMVAVGLYIVSSSSKITHLAIGATGAAAAYGAFWGIMAGWPLGLAIIFGLAVALMLGLAAARLLEPFAARREPLLGLIASFAMGAVLEALIAISFGTDGKNFQSGVLPVVNAGGITIDLPGVVTIVLGVLLALVAWALITFTETGRVLRSVAEDSALATSIGVNNVVVRMIAYCSSALVGAAVVGLTGWHTALTPLMGFQLVVAAFIALLMGGVHDIRGTIISSYVVGIVPGIVIGYVGGLSENWRLVFVFCIAAVILAIRPHGILGKQMREA